MPHHSTRGRFLGLACLALALAAFTHARVHGQTTYTWNNFAGAAAGGNLLWSTTANWNAAPTFNQNATVLFPSSGLQIANNYVSDVGVGTTANIDVNRLVFALDGNAQGINNGQPMILNIGDTAAAATGLLYLYTSSAGVAPGIIQNGSGSVVIQPIANGVMLIEGPNPVLIGGTGTGLVQLNARIFAGSTSGANSGLLINFDPAAVRANNTGASVAIAGANSFTGNVVLQNGNLALGSNTALGVATNQLVVNAGLNSVRVTGAPIIANPVVLNSTMNFTSFDGSTSTWTGAWSGSGGLTFRPSSGMTFNLQGAAGFTGPLALRSLLNGYAGTANDVVFNVGSSATTTGSLATTNIQIGAGGRFVLTNATANATRLAAGTNVTMLRSQFSLVANATVNAAETVGSLTNTGMSTVLLTPQAAAGATLTINSWTRNSNATAYFVGTGLGSAPGVNVANVVFTTNPGGATPGSTTAGTQNLAVLPYAFGNSASTGNAVTSLVRWDAGTGRIVPLNTTTEYAGSLALANGTGAAGLNYRLAGAGNGGAVEVNGTVSANGLVIDTNMAAPAPPVGVALVGSATLNLTGPVLSAYSGSGFPTGVSTFLPNQIAVGGLSFGANTAYFHTPGDVWVRSPISGTGGLVKSGENGSGQADLYLLGNNTFTGGLTINAGRVLFTNDAQLGAAGGGILMNAGGNGGLNLTQNPYYDATPAGNVTVSRPLTLGAAGGSLGVVVQNTRLTYDGLISGTGGLVVQTSGAVILGNAANSFVGDAILRTGTTIVNSDGAFGDPANRVLMGTIGGAALFQPGPGFTSTNRDFILLPSTGAPTIFTNGVDLTINGVISSTQTNFGGAGMVKGGLGTLTLTAANTLGGAVTVGDVAGTVVRVSAPNGTQYGGTLRLSGPNGALPLAAAFTVNDTAALILDNSAGANADRIGTVNVGLGGGSFTLIGNASADVTERVGAISTNTTGTLTLTQPAGTGQVTTLFANALGTANGGTLFVRGTNLGATTGDRTQLLVRPTNLTTSLPAANGIVIGGVAAASDTAGPTDFLAAVNTLAIPTLPQYSLVPLTAYGSLAAPGATVTANQAGAVFTLTSAASLNALRIGAGGGLDLTNQTLTLGTTATAQAGMILAAGGANSGVVGGTIDFGAQTARIVTTNDLTLGTAGSPTALLGTNTGSSLLKSGPGTLTLFGTAATTLGSLPTQSGTLTVAEGTLVLGNATALGRATLNSTSIAPIPNVLPFTVIQRGATLDLSALSATPVRINTIINAGTLALGDATLNTGLSSSNFGGNITGSATSRFIGGLAQSEIPLNTFGGGGPALTGDNSGFLGQWVILRGTMNFASNLSFGTGTSPILFGDTASPTAAVSPTLRIDAGLTVPFPRDVTVQAGAAGLPNFLVGNSSNQSMTGTLTLNKAAGVSGSVGGAGLFTFAGSITGVGQLQLGTSIFGGSGSVAFAAANPGWTGGLLMNTGQSSSGISSIVAVGADNSLGTGTLTLGQFAGLLRADNAARTLANPVNVANTTPTAAFTTNFGTTGVNNLTFTGNVTGTAPSVPATPFSHTLNLNVINQGTTTFAGTVANGAAFNLGVTKNGFGTVVLNGNNSHTGDTVVNAGTIRIGHPNALGFGGRQGMTAVAGATTVNSGAVLDLNGQLAVNEPLTLAGGSLLNTAASPASVAGGTLASLTMTATGGAASAVPTVSLTGGGGSGAAAEGSLGLTQLSLSFTPLTQGGSGYSSAPTVAVTAGGGSGATAVATLGVTTQSFTITNGGAGYTTAPTVTLGGGGGSGATATSTITGGVVTSITITNPGINFLVTPTITFGAAPTGGTTATGIGNATNFQVGSVVLTSPGGGFSSAPTIGFSGGGGTGTTAAANDTNFALGLVVTNPGSGYTSAPTVGFSTGTATATANLSSITLAAGTTSGIGGSGALTVDAPITGTGGLMKVGTGTTILNGTNTYTGLTTISAGVLQVGTGGTTGTLGTGAVVNNASLVYNRSDAVTVTSVISGTGAVTQAGTGALYLNSVNTYSGATTVLGGTLGGTGTVAGATTFAGGSTLRAGNAAGVGTLTLGGGVTAASGANLGIQITTAGDAGAPGSGGSSGGTATAPANNNFVLVSTGGVTADPTTLNYRVDGLGATFAGTQQYSYRVLLSTGQDLSGVVITDPARFTFTNFNNAPTLVSLTGDTGGVLYLNFTPVPEPGTLVLVGAAALGAGAFVRRRFRPRV